MRQHTTFMQTKQTDPNYAMGVNASQGVNFVFINFSLIVKPRGRGTALESRRVRGHSDRLFVTCVAGLDIKLVDAVARGASRFENLLAPLKTYCPPPPKLTGPFLGYISLRYQCIIVIMHRASCISCHSN